MARTPEQCEALVTGLCLEGLKVDSCRDRDLERRKKKEGRHWELGRWSYREREGLTEIKIKNYFVHKRSHPG